MQTCRAQLCVLQKRASSPTQGLYLGEFLRCSVFFFSGYTRHSPASRAPKSYIREPRHVYAIPDMSEIPGAQKCSTFPSAALSWCKLMPTVFHCFEGSHGLHLCSKLKRAGCAPNTGLWPTTLFSARWTWFWPVQTGNIQAWFGDRRESESIPSNLSRCGQNVHNASHDMPFIPWARE